MVPCTAWKAGKQTGCLCYNNCMKQKKPELLVPAGDIERLETAVRFGADAVYVGAGPYSLRAQETSFDIGELRKATAFAHKENVKVYLAMNIFAFDEDLEDMVKYLKEAIGAGIDAAIVSDAGLISLIRKQNKKIKIHLSTQANTLNSEAVKFWHSQGVSRIVLGREVNLEQVKLIRKRVPKIELELFVHGAMCMSYSGRCLLSKHMTGRSANRGECTQPCRWKYELKEANRPDESFPVEEDARGTYIMNSKDLCLIEHIPELAEAGIDSFKIEGRMKSPYYVAVTTKVYREAIDSYYKDPGKYKYYKEWKKELEKTSHRQFTTGFYFGDKDKESSKEGSYVRNYDFVGVVESCSPEKKELEIKARNFFRSGDELEILDPARTEIGKIKVEKIRTNKNEPVEEVHNEFHVFVEIPPSLKASKYSLLRRKK